MADRIHIRDLCARCIIGVNREEREQKQEVVFNISLTCDLSAAAATDDLEKTVDYSRLKNRVVQFAEASDFYLIERLAGCVADLCLEDPRVSAVRVRVDKPGALTFARSVAVEIERTKEA